MAFTKITAAGIGSTETVTLDGLSVINNGSFEEGDAEIYYQMIRYLKPNKILEVGSGHSTLIGLEAVEQNKIEKRAAK